MANEITATASLAFAKGSIDQVSRSEAGFTVTVSGSKYAQHTQNIGTSEEQLDFADITTPGWCFLKNLDTTNYVEIRPATGVADLIRLPAGKACVFPFAADCTAPFAIANSSAIELEILLIEA